MRSYERRLPHWNVIGQPLFVTFRLAGSLPANRVFPPARLTSGKAFVAMDKLLDSSASGPLFLRQSKIAQIVVRALHDGQHRFQRYQVHAFVVMPNHVHLLVTPQVDARRWLGPLKGFTAHEANRILERHSPFWQDESSDHLVRHEQELRQVQRYIEYNPVKAGLVASPEDFPWSSASGVSHSWQAQRPDPTDPSRNCISCRRW
jgi:REP element-mobilizing transposase RayT